MIKRLFIDTDIGGDCDDAGALALANIFKNNNLAELVGMTFTTSALYGPACINAINTYYGNGEVEIGTTYRKNFCDENVNVFQSVLAKNFPNGIYDGDSGALAPVQEAASFIRKKLAAEENGSVTFVCIGQLNNVSDLLETKGDRYSPLSGIELVKAKVKEFVVMGGLFKENDERVLFEGQTYGAEYNIVSDIVSARNFVEKCPVRIVFSDFKVGNKVKTGGTLLKTGNEKHPVTVAYKLFQNRPRESWDLLTVWYATFGCTDLFEISGEGAVTVDDGGNTFFDGRRKGNHFILKLAASAEYAENKIDTTLEKEKIYEEENA